MKSAKNANGILSMRVDANTIKAIEFILSKGDRAEVICAPGGGIKVIHIQKTLISDSGRKTK